MGGSGGCWRADAPLLKTCKRRSTSDSLAIWMVTPEKETKWNLELSPRNPKFPTKDKLDS
uniref:Uncharacterized protein n=1 Tax=Romanomermis culicivorax TaxID=13658 RepID=A0A915IIX3_ROMCU